MDTENRLNRSWDFTILSPTFNRGNLLLDIILDLREESERCGYRTLHLILDDCSSKHAGAYAEIAQLGNMEHANGSYVVSYRRHTENYGRIRFWQTNNELFAMARRYSSKYIVQIPDDGRLCKNFLTRTTDRFEQLKGEDPNICALNLLCTTLMNWHFCRFVDACFIADRRFLEALKWQLEDTHAVNGKGSRVGQQISFRLHRHPSLCIAPSQDISYLKLIDTDSVMYPKDQHPQRPARWWRENFVDDPWYKELLF